MSAQNSMQQEHQELQKNYRKLQRRVFILEQAVEALLEKDASYLQKFPAFNDQEIRKAIFQSLISITEFDFIAETGTKWGNTTAFIAAATQDIPIYSSELIRESFLISRERLKHFSTVVVENLDSREFISKLTTNTSNIDTTPFFYLDAHWYDDLPLREELESIAAHWDQFVVLIDDFKVPNDPGYGFDDYGDGKVLDLDYLDSTLQKFNLKIFFPSTNSTQESGAKRGCAVVCSQGAIYELVKSEELLSEHSISD